MFRRFVAPTPPSPPGLPNPNPQTKREKALRLFSLSPVEIASLLELAWDLRVWDPNFELGHPFRRSDIAQFPDYLLDLFPFAAPNQDLFSTPPAPGLADNPRIGERGTVMWDHLIYAYLIENTRIYEIFRRVIYEYLHGEKLGVPLAAAQHWLRNTEELFFRDPAPFTTYSVVSQIRSDWGASRRNAYYRMFGMDLNHGMDNGQPYPYVKPDAANREFVNTWEEFLREVWDGISHASNTSGANPTDIAAIADLATQLFNLLTTKRKFGNLSRVEFFAVCMMSWFHLTVEFDFPIIQSLRSEASSPEERLKKIAEKVNLPAHGKSYYFFLLAEPMSRILTEIETGAYNTPAAAEALFDPTSPVQQDLQAAITYWGLATGRNMKAKTRPVSVQS